jgi:hypothetical protein
VTPCRIRALDKAATYVGVKEQPAGSNRGPNIDRWCKWANGLTGYPWCAAFACGMVREACGLIVPTPKRDNDSWPDHIGLVTKVVEIDWQGRYFTGAVKTIEGNTSAGDDANGGQVQVRYRANVRAAFIRIDAKKLKPVAV